MSVESPQPFRILSFDGGGLHALSYLPVLEHLEEHLAQRIATSGQFDMLVGTSTGAIVAMGVKLKFPAREIINLYQQNARKIFRKAYIWNRLFFYTYRSKYLRAILADMIGRYTGDPELTWDALSHDDRFCPDVEMVVTLWDASLDRAAFLSTNPRRPGQPSVLRQAAVADVITACCSASYFFPPRSFRLLSEPGTGGNQVFSDGGITGLNNPAAFGASLISQELGDSDRLVDVISFGSGVSTVNHSLEELQQRNVLEIVTSSIDALISSSASLMDKFYSAFGPALRIRKYMRTNQERPAKSKLDDITLIDRLVNNFDAGNVFYQLFSNEQGTIVDSSLITADRATLTTVWENEFDLPRGTAESPAEAPAEAIPVATDSASVSTAIGRAASREKKEPVGVTSREMLPSGWARLKAALVAGAVPLSMVTLVLAVVLAFTAMAERQRAVVRELAAKVPLQDDDEVAVLLARQSHLFNVRFKADAAPLVDRALRRAVNRPYWLLYHHPERKEGALVACSAGGDKIAAVTPDQKILLWRSVVRGRSTEPEVLPGASPQTYGLAMSPAGDLLASCGDDSKVRVWDLISIPAVQIPVAFGDEDKISVNSVHFQQELTKRKPAAGHKGKFSVKCVGFSPDGQVLAAGDTQGGVRLWKPRSGKPPRELKHDGQVERLAFSSDGQVLAVLEWLPPTAAPATDASTTDAPAKDVSTTDAPAEDASTTDAPAEDASTTDAPAVGTYQLRLWNLETGMGQVELEFKNSSANSLVMSLQGRLLAVGGTLDIWLYDWSNFEKPLSSWVAHASNINVLAFSDDGKQLCSGSVDTTIKVWDVGRFSEGLASVADDSLASTAKNPPDLIRQLVGHHGGVTGVAFAGDSLVAASDDGQVRLWDTHDPYFADRVVLEGHTLLGLKGNARAVQSVSFDTTGTKDATSTRLASGGFDGQVLLWQEPFQGTTPFQLHLHDAPVTSVAFSPDGSHLASGSLDKTVRLWSLPSGTVQSPPPDKVLPNDDGGPVFDVAFDSTGKQLAASDENGIVRLWDVDTATSLGTLQRANYYKALNSIAFAPDGHSLLAGFHTDDDSGCCIWDRCIWDLDSKNDAEPVVLRVPNDEGPTKIHSVAYSVKGGRAATDDYKGIVWVWDLRRADRPPLHRFVHGGQVVSVAFGGGRSEESSLLACGTLKGTVHIWDLRRPDMAPRVLLGHEGAVWSLSFREDGKRLASASEDGKIIVWNIDTDELLALVKEKVRRNLTREEWQRHVSRDLPYERTFPDPDLPGPPNDYAGLVFVVLAGCWSLLLGIRGWCCFHLNAWDPSVRRQAQRLAGRNSDAIAAAADAYVRHMQFGGVLNVALAVAWSLATAGALMWVLGTTVRMLYWLPSVGQASLIVAASLHTWVALRALRLGRKYRPTSRNYLILTFLVLVNIAVFVSIFAVTAYFQGLGAVFTP